MNDQGYAELMEAIVIQAAKDWRSKCRANSPSAAFNELRGFFKSDWGEQLCGRLDPLVILKGLEAERENSFNEQQGGNV